MKSNQAEALRLPMTVYASKRKVFRLFIIGVAFVAIAIWDIKHQHLPIALSHQGAESLCYVYLGLLFFGFCSLILLHSMICKKRTLFTIDEKGIFYGSWQDARFAWADIAAIRIVKMTYGRGILSNSIYLIGIFLKDTSTYYASLNRFYRLLASWAEKKCGTPIAWSCDTADVDTSILTEQLNKCLAQYGTKEQYANDETHFIYSQNDSSFSLHPTANRSTEGL